MSQKSPKPRTQSIELINLDDSLEDFKIQPRKLRKTKSSQEISKSQIKSKHLPSVKDADLKKTQSSSSFKSRNDFKLPEVADQIKTVANDGEFVKKVISETTETSQYWAKTLVSRSLPVLEKRDSRPNEILATSDDLNELKTSMPETVEPFQVRLEIKKGETTDVAKDFSPIVASSPLKETPIFFETKPLSNVSIGEELNEVDPPPQSPCPICDNVVIDLANHIKICCIDKFSFAKKTNNGIICGIQYDASNSNGSKKEVKREMCSICEKDITHMTKQRRLQHVNKCADEIPKTIEELREMTFICPFCGLNNDTSESLDDHLKTCGKKLNSQPEALKAGEVEKKACKKPAKKKKQVFPSASPKNLEEAELQMAMALSASLHEEQNSQNSASEVENREMDRVRFSKVFCGAMLPPPKAKGRKKKPIKIYKLALQTEVERSRQLEWRVSELLEGQFNSTPTDDLNWHQTANKCKLWVLSALKGNLARKDFYIDDLIERIESDKMSLSFKPRHKHLSQIAGRHSFGCTANVSNAELDETGPVIISTPSLTPRQSQFFEDGDDTLGGFLSQNSEVASLKSKISSDYSRMVGKEDFSDAKISTVDGEIPVHLIIISVRCPKLMEEFSNELNLDLKHFSHAAVLGFLEFVYTGEYNYDPLILEDLKKLAIKYEQNDFLQLLNQKHTRNETVAVEEEEDNEIYQFANQTLHKIIHSVWDEPNSSKNDEKIRNDGDDWDALLNSDIVLSLSQFISQVNNEANDDLKRMSEVSDNEECGSFLQDRAESMDLSDSKGTDNLPDQCETNLQCIDYLNLSFNRKESDWNLQNHLDKVDLLNKDNNDLSNIASIPELRVESRDSQDAAIYLCLSDSKSQRSNDEFHPKLIKSDEKLLQGDSLFKRAVLDERNSPEAITIPSSSSEAKSDDLSNDFQLSFATCEGSFLLKNLLEKTKEILNESNASNILNESNASNILIDDANTGTKNESNLSLKYRLKNGYYNVVPQSPIDDFPDFKKNSKSKSPRSPVKKVSPKGKSPTTTPTTGIWLNKKYGETTPIKTSGLRTISSIISPKLSNNKSEMSKKVLFPKDNKQNEKIECVSSPDIFASDNEADDGDNNVGSPSINTSLETIKFISAKNTPVKELLNDSPECLLLTSPETPLPLIERLKKRVTCHKTDLQVSSSSARSKRVPIRSPKNVKRKKIDKVEPETAFMNLPDVDGLSPFSEENDGILPLPTKTRRILESADDMTNLNAKGVWKASTQPEKSKLKDNTRVSLSQQHVRKKNIIGTPPVTPMPDYKTMITPELKGALKKVGVKALPRSKAVPLLTRIYDDTHPYVCDADVLPSTSQMPPPDVRKKKKAPLLLNSSSESEFSSSQESTSSSGAAEVLEESTIDESQGINELDYKNKLKLYIKSNPELHARILTYEPIPLKEMHENIKQEGIKLSMPTLMDFLDEQCITFTLPRSDKQREKQQRRQKRFKDRIKDKLKG